MLRIDCDAAPAGSTQPSSRFRLADELLREAVGIAQELFGVDCSEVLQADLVGSLYLYHLDAFLWEANRGAAVEAYERSQSKSKMNEPSIDELTEAATWRHAADCEVKPRWVLDYERSIAARKTKGCFEGGPGDDDAGDDDAGDEGVMTL